MKHISKKNKAYKASQLYTLYLIVIASLNN